METKYITKAALKNWLEKIKADGKQLYAPVKQGDRTDFKSVGSVDEISLEHIQTTQSTKATAFPRAEKLFSYKKESGDVKLQDYNAETLPEVVIFGQRPCDAAGARPLGSIFNWDTPDKPFNERRKRITVISLSCTRCDEYCFCTSMNGSPGNSEGSDILLTPVNEDYLVEIVSEKGKELVEKYGNLFEKAPDGIRKEDYLADVPVRFNVEEILRKLPELFESKLWDEQSKRCIGCGACAYVCPTCACFDIQEDAKGSSGKRIRCWDSCCFSLFTLHTSGHNPRSVQSQRWRQRVMHKFSYMPERLSVIGCTGCGRCSRACSVDMNLAENLAMVEKMV